MCRLAKAESQNRKRRSEGNVEVRNPSPKIRNGQRKVVAINKSRKGKPEKGIERWCQPTKTGDPKRETDSWSEVRPRKPETDNEVYNVDQRKSETSGSWLQATKPEIRNPKPTAKVDFKRRNPKAETRDPKSETDSESGFQATKLETRNSKAETGSESWLQATKPEPRNPKPETGYKRRKPETRNPKPKPETRNPKPKPETRNPKPESRNPKPTWIRLSRRLSGSELIISFDPSPYWDTLGCNVDITNLTNPMGICPVVTLELRTEWYKPHIRPYWNLTFDPTPIQATPRHIRLYWKQNTQPLQQKTTFPRSH